jgi:hypothetical protein
MNGLRAGVPNRYVGHGSERAVDVVGLVYPACARDDGSQHAEVGPDGRAPHRHRRTFSAITCTASQSEATYS